MSRVLRALGGARVGAIWLGARLTAALISGAAVALLAVYVDRLFPGTPLYAGDEGAYLIRALYGRQLAADPTLDPFVQDITNSAYFAIVRLTFAAFPAHLIQWLRLGGACAYLLGILLVFATVRRRLTANTARDVLLLALLFSYYRFVVATTPEGWYVGAFGLLVFVTDKLYAKRPLAHSLVAGLIVGVLVLLKPHGVAIAAAFVGLVAIDLAVCRERYATGIARIVLFALAFDLSGNLVQTLSGVQQPSSVLFFEAPFYAGMLGRRPAPHAEWIAIQALDAMVGGLLILGAAPIAAGVAQLGLRIAQKERPRQLQPAMPVYLLVLLSMIATVAMVAIFAYRATAIGESETKRLWGRYFEFFVPLLWVAAAPLLVATEALGGKLWRGWLCGLSIFGLVLLWASFLYGTIIFPWDSSTLSAFYLPNAKRLAFAIHSLYVWFATASVLLAAGAVLIRAPTMRIWLALFAVLAVLSTLFDREWENADTPGKHQLAADLVAAKIVTDTLPRPTAVVADDINFSHITFLQLEAHVHMIFLPAGGEVEQAQLAQYGAVIIEGAHKPPGGWFKIFQGTQLAIYRRGPVAVVGPAPRLAASLAR